MTARGERTLIQYLTDPTSLDVIAQEGVDPILLPSETLRPIYLFALNYFFDSGRVKAPSVAAIRAEETWVNALEDHQIDLEAEPEDSVEWAIDDLKASYVYRQTQTLNKELATAMAEAEMTDRVEVLSDFASRFVSLSMRLESHTEAVDITEGISERFLAYHAREADRGSVHGLRFGISEIDDYTRGLHPGELGILSAPPKAGKSYMLDRVAWQEWAAGRSVALFTLENSIEMTIDRIACMACGVDSRAWQHGELPPETVERVRDWIDNAMPRTPLWVLSPAPGKRSVVSMVRQAQLLGADSLLIDQLTFIELSGDPRKPKTERIGETLHDLHVLISTGRDRMPCLLAHQINREGVKMLQRTGWGSMEYMADSAEVERTADWVWLLYQSRDQRAAQLANLQTLGARREDLRHFELTWMVDTGGAAVNREIHEPTTESST